MGWNAKKTLVRRAGVIVGGSLVLAAPAAAQIPDLLTSFDSGSRSSGAAGILNAVGADPGSTYYNPAALGYIDKKAVSASYRNLPITKTKSSGRLEDPSYDTKGYKGSNALSNLSLAVPLKRGVIGLSYSIGGYLNDKETGALTQNGDPLEIYDVQLKSQTDFYTLAYGFTTKDSMSSYGIGLVYAQQRTQNVRKLGQNSVVLLDQDFEERGSGLGVIIGGEWIPKKMPSTTIGLSYRSPIQLKYGSGDAELYEQIPGRLAASLAIRQDGFRGGKDFLVYGLQAQYFFAGQSDGRFERGGQFVAGVGAEYNYRFGQFRVPLRVGYLVSGKGNSVFDSRNVFTFGVGLRPIQGNYTIDVNYGIPRGGGYDMAFTVGYRF